LTIFHLLSAALAVYAAVMIWARNRPAAARPRDADRVVA